MKDTAFSAGCTPYNLELPTSPPTTQSPTTTANPCGSDFKCESTSAYTYCIKPFQVKFFKLFKTRTHINIYAVVFKRYATFHSIVTMDQMKLIVDLVILKKTLAAGLTKVRQVI
jgi:hypothetical protein